jgi:hypothetical protein
VLPPSTGLMMEAAHTSETPVDNYFTRQYIPEDKSELHFMFYICRISIHRFLYFNFFSVSFCITFLSDGIATRVIIIVITTTATIITIIISCHRFSSFPGTSSLEPVVNPTTQASRLSL